MVPPSSRFCSETRLRKGVHIRRRHEEKCPQSLGCGHRWTLPRWCQEERRETAALWYVWNYSSHHKVHHNNEIVNFEVFSSTLELKPVADYLWKYFSILTRPSVAFQLNNSLCLFTLLGVFFAYRLQCVCGRSGWCWHEGADSYWQQAQWEARVCCGWLRRFWQNPGQPDHFHLWNGHIQ